jgi:hypothetical protein
MRGCSPHKATPPSRYLWREAILLDPDEHRIFIYHAGKNRLDPPWRVHSDAEESVQ